MLGSSTDTQSVDGQTLKLNIDLRLQNIVAQALEDELVRRTAKYGPEPKLGAAAVVLNPSTGAVLAMVSLPDYSSQQFAGGISQQNYQTLLNDPGDPLLNRATQGQYPPGSTIKPFVGAGGLQSGTISKDFSWTTPCVITIGAAKFPDWTCHHTAYSSNVDQAIADSNDVFFYALGGGYAAGNIKGMGIDTMNLYLSQFGIGSKTGIDLPSESTGLLANDAWKRAHTNNTGWFIGDTYHSAIGQGFTLATPLQMAVATSAIANGGTVYAPQLAHGYVNQTTNKEQTIAPTVVRSNFISPDNIQTISAGMRQTVLSGSARPLNTLTVTSAGKTGSAQVGANNQSLDAWYEGFAPYDHPQIAFSIMIEGDDDSFYSSVPVAEEILRGYFNDPLAPGQSLSSNLGSVGTEYQGEH